jgi:hypothetical protein
MFDESAVEELCLRRQVDREQLARTCPNGLFVVRLPRVATLDLCRPWREVAGQVVAAVTAQRPMTPLTAAIVSVRIGLAGSLPLVAT